MIKKINLADFLINNSIIVVLVLLVIVTGILQPAFFSAGNAGGIVTDAAALFIIACGLSGCLITKGVDLSAGRMVGLTACIAGTLLQRPEYADKFWVHLPDFGIWWVAAVLLICVAVACVFGCINGLVITFLQVPAFIATLGMQLILYGICRVYTDGASIGGYRDAYIAVAKNGIHLDIPRLFPIDIPFLLIIALIIGIVIWFVYNKTSHGKNMYVTGGSNQAAEESGISTKKTRVIVYITAAALYALAGFLAGARFGGASSNMGQGWELEAIAACAIGGVSVNGGTGRVSGVLLGVLVFVILKTCFQHLGVSVNCQYIIQGVVLVAALALNVRKYAVRK